MPTINFFTDFDRDLGYIKNDFPFLRSLFDMNRLLQLYYPNLVGKNDAEISNFFEQNKDSILQQLKTPSEHLENLWKPLNDDFFKQVGKITSFRWKNKKYFCHLSSSFICGGRYERPNIIVVFPRAAHTNPLQTIPHELFHLHFWDFLGNMGIELSNEKMNELWDLSETIDFILEGLNIKGLKYKSNLYPQHKKLYEKIRPLWKGDFENFIKESLKVAKTVRHKTNK